MIRLGVLGSTRGSDLVPIVEAIKRQDLDASVEIIISNNKRAPILDKGNKYKIPSVFIEHKNRDRLDFDREVSKNLLEKNISYLFQTFYHF